MKKLYVISLAFILASCQQSASTYSDLTQYVDPFIGTATVGHTFPGAQVPFGMVQVGPDTGPAGTHDCTGYHDSDEAILGFSHTHLSGTGIRAMGDILFMPTVNNPSFEAGDPQQTGNGYHSKFSHDSEEASPGYYKVTLDDSRIDVELTATARTAFHQYTYPATDQPGLLIDLEQKMGSRLDFGHLTSASFIKLLNDTTIVGMKQSKDYFVKNKVDYFYAITSVPVIHALSYTDGSIEEKTEAAGALTKMYLQFGEMSQGNRVKIKVALSTQSVDAAKMNLEAENKGWDFDTVRNDAKDIWNKHLQLFEVEAMDDAQKASLYTALYHTLVMPNLITDVDGTYSFPNGTRGKSTVGDYYTNFSLWDTYRAEHPFLELILPEKNAEFVRSMIAVFKENGLLHTNEYGQNETWCMIANHATSVIADAYVKGTIADNKELAAESIFKSLTNDHFKSEWSFYDRYGYFPFDNTAEESVSRTLESCYNDYCAAEMAKLIGNDEMEKYFSDRAKNYENLFDPTTKMMRGKDTNGNWRTPFAPSILSHSAFQSGDYTEGNAWQYTWHVQQDALNLIKLMGGNDAFANKLDSLFTIELPKSEKDNAAGGDVTGLIGQYAHGNEPSHHIIYLYTMANHPWRTAELVREVFDKFYKDSRDGLCGMDDCGQMSAWFLFSAMGFYPVSPISGEYVIGAPQVHHAKLNMPSGTLEMTAHDLSKDNKYVESVVFNGKKINTYYISYNQIKNGGKLEFYMTNKPIQFIK